MTLSALFAWLRGDGPQYVPHWTRERAMKAERETLRMLGRGETAYQWSARYKARQKPKPVLSMERHLERPGKVRQIR